MIWVDLGFDPPFSPSVRLRRPWVLEMLAHLKSQYESKVTLTFQKAGSVVWRARHRIVYRLLRVEGRPDPELQAGHGVLSRSSGNFQENQIVSC